MLVPPGEFLRGSPEDDEPFSLDEYPPQRMRVDSPFYFGGTEVTRAQWLRVMEFDQSMARRNGTFPAI